MTVLMSLVGTLITLVAVAFGLRTIMEIIERGLNNKEKK